MDSYVERWRERGYLPPREQILWATVATRCRRLAKGTAWLVRLPGSASNKAGIFFRSPPALDEAYHLLLTCDREPTRRRLNSVESSQAAYRYGRSYAPRAGRRLRCGRACALPGPRGPRMEVASRTGHVIVKISEGCDDQKSEGGIQSGFQQGQEPGRTV